jgi:hypothetical protein
MTGWARTGDGWALNVDGSDAATQFSLPRLELHSSAQGWQCLCLLAHGRSHQTRGSTGSTSAAKRATVEEARVVLGAEYAGVLDELLELR